MNLETQSLVDGAPAASVRNNEIIGRNIMDSQPKTAANCTIGAASDRGRVVGAAKPEQKNGPAYPPRGMRVEQAADYLSMSRSTFLGLVKEGKMPKPIKIGAMTTWDRYDIDDAFEDFKRGVEPSGNTIHKILGIKP
jgi:predicted DNA-binding transcriptional regulator AlpA